MTSPNGEHPLLRVRLESATAATERLWYHCPRLGDEIRLAADGNDNNVYVEGTVRSVVWDDWVVTLEVQ